MRSGNTARPSPRRPIEKRGDSYGKTCCSTSPATWFPSDPIAANPARSNTGPKPIRCSTNRADASSKSPTAAATGKEEPAIIEALTKGHSGLTPLPLLYLPLRAAVAASVRVRTMRRACIHSESQFLILSVQLIFLLALLALIPSCGRGNGAKPDRAGKHIQALEPLFGIKWPTNYSNDVGAEWKSHARFDGGSDNTDIVARLEVDAAT